MQERTIDEIIGGAGAEGRLRQFIQENDEGKLRERLIRLHKTAIRDPRTQSVMQRKIGRNELCPCGSGRKFKYCCIVKVNKGEEIVSA